MKKRGFTLIELLAVIVILGVIMIIAIPSVTNYITNSRKDSYLSDAQMFVNAAKTMLTANTTLPQEANEKIIVPISEIALDKGGEKSPYGNDWNYEKSFVVVVNIGTSSDPEYVWKVALSDTKGNCIPLTEMNKLKREIVGTNCLIPETLISKIAPVAESDEILDFNVTPTETVNSGIYVKSGTEDDKYPIYYYRGLVDNNNVRFADFCWKIVRTTETGGIKLIYNGKPQANGSCDNSGVNSLLEVNSSFNENFNDNAYVGYMYGTVNTETYEETHANINNSPIKNIVDTWYQENMTDYTWALEDTVWCNDRSIVTYNNLTGPGTKMELTYYGGYVRVGIGAVDNLTPSLECINKNDRFTVSPEKGNGKLTYPVGLLTADEAAMAGFEWTGRTKASYLHSGSTWRTMTPLVAQGRAYVIGVYGMGGLGYDVVDVSLGVRPAISLRAGSTFTKGDGTVTNPYIVE